jgi:hypothetical protein
VPFSYAQYAGNGSTTTFSVPFPYLLKAHVKLYTGYNILTGAFTSQLVEGTNYTWTSGTQVQTTVAPANGVTLTVLRDTPDSSQLVPWQDGSNLIADDFNNADLQNLYVVQEQQDRNDVGAAAAVAAQTAANTATAAATAATTAANTANATAAAATTAANNATTAANASTAASTAATATANSASTNAAAAVSTANTAASNASTALSTANTASTNASNAVTTANTAASNAGTALSTANTAASNASTALSTANTAAGNASTALSTANTASANASAAVSTANTASTNASNAVTTANQANTTANNAAAAVSNAVLFTLVNNAAAIPASPANNTYIEVVDSTGIESFSPLVGVPAGFVGDAGLTVRLRYTTAGTTWNYLSYFANNPETRYIGPNGGTITGQLRGSNSNSAATPGYAFNGDPDTGMGRPGPNELGLATGGVYRLTFDSAGNAAFTGPVTIPAGSSVSGYLDAATAASTYQTQAGMSSYLTTTAAGTTYAPLASPTFTGTVTIPAGAIISGYLTTAIAASTYQTQAGMSGYLATGAIGTTVQAYNANNAVTDVVQSFSKAQRGTYVTLTDAATVAIDLSLGNHFQLTLGGNRVIGAPTNVVAGQSGVIRLVQDGTGSRTASWNSVFKFPGGTAPTLTTAANSVDLLAFHVESASRIAVRFIGDVK